MERGRLACHRQELRLYRRAPPQYQRVLRIPHLQDAERNTDKELTAAPAETVVKNLPPSKGLESNPGTTGEIFSNSHPYYPENCGKCPFNKGVGRLIDLTTGRKRNCNQCKRTEDICGQYEWQNFKPAPTFVMTEEKYNELTKYYDT
jgi:hypothetical protein